jgi:hypothetical protein
MRFGAISGRFSRFMPGQASGDDRLRVDSFRRHRLVRVNGTATPRRGLHRSGTGGALFMISKPQQRLPSGGESPLSGAAAF